MRSTPVVMKRVWCGRCSTRSIIPAADSDVPSIGVAVACRHSVGAESRSDVRSRDSAVPKCGSVVRCGKAEVRCKRSAVWFNRRAFRESRVVLSFSNLATRCSDSAEAETHSAVPCGDSDGPVNDSARQCNRRALPLAVASVARWSHGRAGRLRGHVRRGCAGVPTRPRMRETLPRTCGAVRVTRCAGTANVCAGTRGSSGSLRGWVFGRTQSRRKWARWRLAIYADVSELHAKGAGLGYPPAK